MLNVVLFLKLETFTGAHDMNNGQSPEATDPKHRMNLSGSYHKRYSQHLQFIYLDSIKSSPKDLGSSQLPRTRWVVGCCSQQPSFI